MIYETPWLISGNKVETEPRLQPLSGEHFEYKSANCEDARSDIKVNGFWRPMRSLKSLCQELCPLVYYSDVRNAEKSKEREYLERIRNVEHGDFDPLMNSEMNIELSMSA